MLSGILSSAISGLNVNSQRASAAADNIANVSTANYKRTEIQGKTISVDQTSSTHYSAGGVLATSRQLSDVGAGDGAVNNGVDLGTEFVNLIHAESAYKANAKVMQAGQDMAKALLDVKA
jgi:flagellar hook protein FlgE